MVGGQWHCSQDVCDSKAEIFGMGHIQTFDGKEYSFPMFSKSCNYYAVKVSIKLIVLEGTSLFAIGVHHISHPIENFL